MMLKILKIKKFLKNNLGFSLLVELYFIYLRIHKLSKSLYYA